MEARNYRNYTSVREVSGIIAYEVVYFGKSTLWQGNLKDLDELKNILANFNIKYVDDMYGTWKLSKTEA